MGQNPYQQPMYMMGGGQFSNFGTYQVPMMPMNPFPPQQQMGVMGLPFPPHPYYDQFSIEQKFYEKFDCDIYEEVTRIQAQLDLTKEERTAVFQNL